MTLHADIELSRVSGFTLRLPLTVETGEVVALLGPNGAGKTTALRAVAGLLRLTGGRIAVDGTTWDAPPDHFTPPAKRTCGVVFQDYLLFEHMSALDNVAFGPRARGADRRTADRRARELLAEVGLADRADASPRALSGGQAQRVALARALATTPDVLLLDEPLAALDAGTRASVRSRLRHHLNAYGGRTLLVTHDPLDAMVLADRLIIVEDGGIVQEGSPGDVAARPRTDYVARLVGLNLLRGDADGDRIRLDGGGELISAEPTTGPVHIVFPPSAVALHREHPQGSPRNVWPVTVAGLEQHAAVIRVHAEGRPSVVVDVTAVAVAELDLVPGARLWASLKATELTISAR
ncbi:ABC transporter ATP-binding protein [Stackebrandtia soli]|uniref:ABC transporter ATP-binding protein n=1 Tax=Stackebrandtia soli TaxID=1892856 RepID=UPI0039EA4832